MCGIAGVASVIGVTADDQRLVDTMLESLAHRGPDDHHTVSDASSVLGARRLAIIDLDTGRQPLSNEDGSIVASQNGEIYNYVELRRDLEAAGHIMKTKGDTEVLVHAYEEWGSGFVERLRGMFAVAIWDANHRRLVLARDRLGKKPLYWRLADGRLTYGSEVKALLADPTVPRRIDREALALYLQYQYVPAPQTIFKDVHKLAPASMLVWEGVEPHVSRYWTPAYGPKSQLEPEVELEECLRVLREAVRLRLRSDVPLGVFLSGGMDSSVVTALMVEASERTVRTFSIGFREEVRNELPYARAVAEHLETDHVDDIVTIDAVELLPKLAYHFDEPFGDPSALPTYRVAEMAAKDLKVVLTGDGGDESFGGYTRYLRQDASDSLARMPGSRVLATAADVFASRAPAPGRLRRRAAWWRQLVGMTSDERYVARMSIIPPSIGERLSGEPALADQSAYLQEALRSGEAEPLDRLLRTDVLTYLPEDLLVKVDRACMASSLEPRSPLLDHELVEFVAKLPTTSKIEGGESKVLLRRVAKTLMPARLVDRPKMGFGVPMDQWFGDGLGGVFSDLVLASDSASGAYLDRSEAGALLDEHRRGGAAHGHALWAVLMFEQWARTWL